MVCKPIKALAPLLFFSSVLLNAHQCLIASDPDTQPSGIWTCYIATTAKYCTYSVRLLRRYRLNGDTLLGDLSRNWEVLLEATDSVGWFVSCDCHESVAFSLLEVLKLFKIEDMLGFHFQK